ncbi:MAG: rhomboid family intramembrane serine protease [Pseudomonadota bacterium]
MTPDRMVIFTGLTEGQAETYGLVLSSAGIRHQSEKTHEGWTILVDDSDYDAALEAVREYVEENAELKDSDEYRYGRSTAGAWAGFLLLLSYLLIGSEAGSVQKYGASAARILDGELYRTATALMVHLNDLHLAGNVVGIVVFGTAVCSIAGSGAGSLMILATGAIGNLASALLYKTDHLSAGASTAVFGALGIVSAHQFCKKFRMPGRKMRSWIPIAGGLALLGLLGSGKGSDLAAHLLGYIAGLILGVCHSAFLREPLGRTVQVSAILVTLAIIISCLISAT